jgi:hypothetical protein
MGTPVTPYPVTIRPDGSSHIVLQSIMAMPHYQDQSHEELRWADAPSTSGDGFGAPLRGGGGRGRRGVRTRATIVTFESPFVPPVGRFGAPSGGVVLGAPSPAPMGAPASAATGGFLFGSTPLQRARFVVAQVSCRPSGWSPFPASTPWGSPGSWGAPAPMGNNRAPAVGAPAGC